MALIVQQLQAIPNANISRTRGHILSSGHYTPSSLSLLDIAALNEAITDRFTDHVPGAVLRICN